MGSLTIEDVSKIFDGPEGEIIAVDDVSLDIEDGEFVVLVGPSGSGKSTILRMIAGLESVTEGTVRLNEEDITGRKPKDRDVAMVFQNYALYPHLTARGNMAFGLKMRGKLTKEQIDERVEEAAQIMEIEDLLEKMPSELSGGQKQRVALGRAIVRHPDVFLMDEPLSNLDAKLRRLMRTEIQELQRELGVTTIYVTHDQTEAMTMGETIVILDGGEVQQIATPVEAFYQPQNTFVAGFIGTPEMNLIDVSVESTGSETRFDHTDFSLEASQRLQQALSTESSVILGIRPGDIQLAHEETQRSIEVTIDVIEPLGDETLLYFTLGAETYIASISELETTVRLSKGDQVHLKFPPEYVHLFDAQTGAVITNRTTPENLDAPKVDELA